MSDKQCVPIKKTNEELVALYQGGDHNSLSDLITQNSGLAWKMALKLFPKDGSDIEDAVQVANMTLMKCAAGFDVTRGFKFSTYACNSIFRSLLRFKDHAPPLVRIPDCADQKVFHFGQLANYDHDPLSELEDYREVENADVPDADDVRELTRRIQFLDAKSRIVITKHRFHGQTLAEIGKEIGVCKQRAGQIEMSAMRRIRENELDRDAYFPEPQRRGCRHPCLRKYGLTRDGLQRYRCKKCGQTISDPKPIPGMQTKISTLSRAMELLFSGMSIRKSALQLGLSKCTLCRLILRSGAQCDRFLHARINPHDFKEIEVDEVFGIIQNNGRTKKTRLIIDSRSRLIVSYEQQLKQCASGG